MGATAQRRLPLTPWELPLLQAPTHLHRRSRLKRGRERGHYMGILSFVHRNHFVIAQQVQRRFPSHLRSSRTTRRHLEELESLGYLATAPARGVSPLFPKVYFVPAKGLRRLQKALAGQGRPWRASRVDRKGRHAGEGFTAEHLLHEILISEFMLALWQTTQARSDLELLTTQRRSLTRHPAFVCRVDGRQTRVMPDALFLVRQAGAGMICCLVEVDLGTMTPKQLRSKFRRYDSWAQSEAGNNFLLDLYRKHGATNPRPAFRILVAAKDRDGTNDLGRATAIGAAAARWPRVTSSLWLTTLAHLRAIQGAVEPLNGPIWYRGRDIGKNFRGVAAHLLFNSNCVASKTEAIRS